MPQYEYLDENDNPIPEDVALSGAFNVVDDQPDITPQISSSEPDTGFLSGIKRAIQSNLEDPLTAFLPGHMPSYDSLNEDLTYNPDQPRKPQTMADVLHTAVNAGGDEITSGISGLLSRAENNINPILGTDSQMGEALRQETLPYRQDRNATLDSVSPTSGLGIASNLVRSGVGMSPALLPGVGLLGSAGIMGLQTAGNKYAQMRDQGVSPENAASASNVAGAGTGLTSLLPLGVLKKEAGPLLKIIESMAAGAGFGEMNVPLDTYANYVGTGEAPTYDEMVSQIPRAAGMGAALGGILGAAHGIAGKVGKGRDSSGVDLNQFVEDGAPGETQLQLPAPEAQLGLPAPPGMEGGQQALPAPDSIIGDNFTARQPTSQEAYISRAMSEPQIPEANLPIDSQVPILKGQPEAPSEGVLPEFSPPKTNQGIEIQTTSARSPEEQIAAQQAQQQIAEAQKPPLFGPNGEPLTQAAAPEGSQIVAPFTQKGEVRKALSPEEAKIATTVAKPKPPIDLTKLEGEQSFVDVKKEIQKQEVQRQVAPGGTAKSRAAAAEQVKMNLAPELEGASPSTLASRLKGERGAITTEPLQAAIDKAGDVKEGIRRFVRGGDDNLDPISTTQAMLEGGRMRFMGKNNPLGAVRRQLKSLSAIGQTEPRAARFLEANRRLNERQHAIVFDAQQTTEPFYQLPPKSMEKVEKLAFDLRKKALEVAKSSNYTKRLRQLGPQDYARMGLDPKETEGMLSLRQAFDNGLEIQRQTHLLDAAKVQNPEMRAKFVEDVNKYIDAQKGMFYVPLSRFGKAAHVVAMDNEGNVINRQHFDSINEAIKVKKKFEAQGIKARAAEALKDDYDGHLDIAPSMLPDAQYFNPNRWNEMVARGENPSGFTQHLLRASGVEGHSTDLRRNTGDYFLGLSRWAAKKKYQATTNDILNEIDPNVDPLLRGMLVRHRDDMLNPKSGFNFIFRAANAAYMAATPLLYPVNIQQTYFMALPEAIHALGADWNPANHGKGWEAFHKGMLQAHDYMSDSKSPGALSFKKRNPDLWNTLQTAERAGLLATQKVNEFTGYTGKPGESIPIDKRAMLFLALGERTQRVTSFAIGHNIAKKLGMSGVPAYEFARDFMYKTVPDPTNANRPELARGTSLGKLAFLYKNWMFTNFENYGRWSGREAWPTILTSLGLTMAAGGYFAAPGGTQLKKALQAAGWNPDKWTRENFPEMADQIIYGLPFNYLNSSSSIQTQELLPELDKGLGNSIAKGVFGPAYDLLYAKPMKALTLLGEGKPRLAFEAAAPRAPRNWSKLQRMYAEGKLTDASGATLIDNPTLNDYFQLAMGAVPPQMARAYEKKNSAYDMVQQDAANARRINDQFNAALQNNDHAEAGRIIQEARKLGIEPRKRPAKPTDPIDQVMENAPRRLRSKLSELKGLYEQ